MLKKLVNDNSGNALIVAMLVMVVAVLMVASFTSNITTSTKIDTSVSINEQAYLNARTGMQLLKSEMEKDKDTLDADQFAAKYANKDFSGQLPDYGEFHGTIKKLTDGTDRYSITCYGVKGDNQFQLYQYASAPEEEEKPKKKKGSDVDRAAIITYGNSMQFSAGVSGLMLLLGNNSTFSQTNAQGTLDVVAARGNMNLNLTSTGHYGMLYSLGKVNLEHGVIIKDGIWCNEFLVGSSTSGVTLNGPVNTIGDLKLTSSGNNYVNGTSNYLFSGGNMYLGKAGDSGTHLYIEGNVYCCGDLYIYGDVQFTGTTSTIYVGGNCYIYGGKGLKVYCKGNIEYDGNYYSYYTNQSTARLLYARGNIDVLSNDGNVDSVQANQSVGDTAYDDVLDKKLAEMLKTTEDELAKHVPQPTGRPVTTVPDSAKGTVVTSGTSLPTESGFFVVDQSCTLKFDVGSFFNGTNKILLRSTGTPVDIYIDSENFTFPNNGNGCFYVDDNGHNGLIRIFLSKNVKNIDLKAEWPFMPYNVPALKTGCSEYSYVPNLYIFQEEGSTTTSAPTYGSFFYNNGNKTCFAGYWLTPNLTVSHTESTIGMTGDPIKEDPESPVTQSNHPAIHGMFTCADFSYTQNNNSAVIKYHDPDNVDDVVGMDKNPWEYTDAIDGVYNLNIS